MGHLTIDETMRSQLHGLAETIEIRDVSGELLGHFTPCRPLAELSLHEKAKRLFDPVEIKRRKEAEHGRGYTIEQVMEHLKSLETSG